MTWLTDTSQVILNEWHVCFNAVSNTKFSAMAVNVDDEVQWLIDPWCRQDKEQLYVQVTHFQHYPENPIIL